MAGIDAGAQVIWDYWVEVLFALHALLALQAVQTLQALQALLQETNS
jgi:hypothetical protein